MCGIGGIWGGGGLPALERMVAAMRHRGPDDSGTFHDERVALGMTRLAVIDLSPEAHQPMCGAGGDVWIVYNGETYNFAEQRRLLEAAGHTFRSGSDTEVVLRLYEAYGDAFVTRLRGMFALAVYDRRGGPGRERLLLARDHFGVKPLLLAPTPHGLAFASELKALLASGLVRAEVDPVALRQLLTYGSVRQPRTILRGVSTLLPGHRLVHDARGTRTERYWALGSGRQAELARLSPDDRRESLREALATSTRLQMASDVPLGAFLSGGIDSTLLVALMAAESGAALRTYSVGFGEEGADLDESDLAAATARLLGTEHTRVVLRGTDVRDALPRLAWALDQPSVDGANTYFVSQVARAGVTVAISGLGGDELFAGYPFWFDDMLEDDARDRARPARAAVKRLASALAGGRVFDGLSASPGGGTLRRLREYESTPARFASCNLLAPPDRAAALLAPGLRAEAGIGCSYHRDFEAADELGDAPLLDRISALCARSYMSDQLLRDVDAVSMAHSLEVRVPLVDPELADLALSLPARDRLDLALPRGAQRGKRVLQDVLDRLLPGRPVQPEKRGFAMPFGAWLRGPLADALDDATDPSHVRARGLLDADAVTRAVAEFRANEHGRTWRRPWVLLVLEQWCRQVLDRALALLWCVAALSGA